MLTSKFILFSFLGWQGQTLVREQYERARGYRDATEVARVRNKPMLVVGGPAVALDRNPLIRLLRIPHHGCGDVCLDIDVTTCRVYGENVERVEADVRSIPYPDGYFGSAFASHVLEHLPTVEDCALAYSELQRVADEVIIISPSKQDVIAWLHPEHHLWVRQTPVGLFIEQR